MSDTLRGHAEALLDAATRAGAEAADVLVSEGSSLSIDVRAGALEQAERAEGVEIGLRVLLGQRQACVSASDTAPHTLEEMARRAVAMAREAPEDPYVGLAEPEELARDWDIAALDLMDPEPDPAPATLQEHALAAEAAALAVEGVSQVQSASAAAGWRAVELAATNGFRGGYARSSRIISCVAITGEGSGMERDYHFEGRTHWSDMPDAAGIGRIAGERAAARANPRRPRTGAWPVIYDERIASSLIGHLLAAINGTAIARGASWLRDALGEQVLPEGLSLIEEPHRPRISGSRPFDAEGLATARREIVARGRLEGWVLDLATARKLGMQSTANAQRSTAAPPSPGTSNVTLTPGRLSRDALLRETGTGLLVTSMLGASINPTTGDYSRGASGYWIENGEIAWPVNECTIAGNLRDMLLRLTPADDARPHLSMQVPSLRVEGLVIAGE